MTLEQRVETISMKKYNITVKSIYFAGESVSVGLGIYSSRMGSVPLFSIEIEVEQKEDATISYYESEAIKEAVSLIHDIADKLRVTA
ncbi:hypothetical protein A6J71_09725 [Enterobacter cancerogenus]|uniref:DUF1327 domain-containing protein n=1 Tax=Enterobacter cancerogenus TaxID=69218 RepID=UPI000C9A67BD|nr:DUF1327 domain-containing protein [Enterobacter cancerogenus]PNF10413.1 hypothetical protein A6J71_09725 [Enterobacter cancerogenus]